MDYSGCASVISYVADKTPKYMPLDFKRYVTAIESWLQNTWDYPYGVVIVSAAWESRKVKISVDLA